MSDLTPLTIHREASALFRTPAIYSVGVVFNRLLSDWIYAIDRDSVPAIGDAVGLSPAATYRALRILKKLGLLQGDGMDLSVPLTADPRTRETLKDLVLGHVEIDVQSGTITDLRTGADLDLSTTRAEIGTIPTENGTIPTENGSSSFQVNGAESTLSTENGTLSQDSQNPEVEPQLSLSAANTLVEETSTQPDGAHNFPAYMLVYGVRVRSTVLVSSNKKYSNGREIRKRAGKPAKPKTPRNRPGRPATVRLDPATDPLRADIEAVHAYANEVWKTRHKLLDDGRVVGRTSNVLGRYDIIRRAMAEYGYTVDQLKAAIDLVKLDSWWSKNALDCVKLMTKESNIATFVTMAEQGRRPTPDKNNRNPMGYSSNDLGKEVDGEIW